MPTERPTPNGLGKGPQEKQASPQFKLSKEDDRWELPLKIKLGGKLILKVEKLGYSLLEVFWAATKWGLVGHEAFRW